MTRNETHGTQRVAVLADSQNLYHTARSLHERNIDYAALLDAAVDGRSLTRAIAYVIKANSPEEESFLASKADTDPPSVLDGWAEQPSGRTARSG